MPPSVRILHLIETLKLGGAEKALYTVLSAMDKHKRFESMVCCLFEDGPIASRLEQLKIPVYNLHMKSPYDWRKGVFRLAEIIKENKIDIVHTHLFYANVYGRIAGCLSGVKTIITTLHNPDYTYEDNGRFSFKARKLIDKYTGRMFNRRFIAVSQSVKDDYQKHMGLKDIDVLYNSIDFKELKINPSLDIQAERKALGLEKEDFVLLNIGRLHNQKGQIYLLEAMKILTKENARFKLLIVGAGPLRQRLSDEIAKNGLTKNVFLLGEREDIVKLFQLSDVFVFPSIYEAFGVVAAEAMAMEKIVVVSDIDGLREVVGPAGVYVKCRDSRGIADSVRKIFNRPADYNEMKKEAGRRALDLFSVENNAGKLEKVYLECSG